MSYDVGITDSGMLCEIDNETEYWYLSDVVFEFGTPIGMATIKLEHNVFLDSLRPEDLERIKVIKTQTIKENDMIQEYESGNIY